MLKNLIINNIVALLIHILIVLLMLSLVFIKGQSLGFVWGPVWAWGGLSVYVIAGFLLAGKILLKHESIWVNFLSVSLIALLGIAAWLYCWNSHNPPFPSISKWFLFELCFPFSEPFDPEETAYLIFAIAPSVLIGFGMMIKR